MHARSVAVTTAPAVVLPTVRDAVFNLSDGSTLTLSGHVPADVAQRRACVRGAQLYLFGGTLLDPHQPDTPPRYTCGYLGKAATLYRADTSYRFWVQAQHRIQPAGIALLRHQHDYAPDYLSTLEARTIQELSTGPGNIVMLNRQTSANLACARLTRTQIHTSQHLADEIAVLIWQHIYAATTNPYPVPHASNAREAAVRCILHATRALDIPDILTRLADAGHPRGGNSPDRSTRRDLLCREDRGRQRIHTGWHRGRRVFWAPALTKADALTAYDHAKPLRYENTRVPTATGLIARPVLNGEGPRTGLRCT